MPRPDQLSDPEPQVRIAIPYAGDRAVARSIADVHVPNPWTGRCRCCEDPYPCRERSAADLVLSADPARDGQRWLSLYALGWLTVAGLVLIAAAVVALGR